MSALELHWVFNCVFWLFLHWIFQTLSSVSVEQLWVLDTTLKQEVMVYTSREQGLNQGWQDKPTITLNLNLPEETPKHHQDYTRNYQPNIDHMNGDVNAAYRFISNLSVFIAAHSHRRSFGSKKPSGEMWATLSEKWGQMEVKLLRSIRDKSELKACWCWTETPHSENTGCFLVWYQENVNPVFFQTQNLKR